MDWISLLVIGTTTIGVFLVLALFRGAGAEEQARQRAVLTDRWARRHQERRHTPRGWRS
jgi:hypothetical protein